MKNANILLIEDNEGDVVLTVEALKMAKINNTTTVIYDGMKAMEYFMQLKMTDGAAKPDLILLDINLPKVNGRELLSFIKKDELLKVIPVIILTTSSALDDIEFSYSNHANSYIVKPDVFGVFFDTIKTLTNFWMNIVALPNQTA